MSAHHVLVAAGDHVLAGDVLIWYQSKLNAIKALVQPTLAVVALCFVIIAYVAFRSWKKAVIAGIGGAIVIAIVANITGMSSKFKSELSSGPAQVPASVVHVSDVVRRV